MKDDSKTMESFILQNLKKELSELHEDRKQVASNVAKLESFIVDALAKEIAEFHSDKKDLAETKVKLVRESKVKFEAMKKDFITRSSKISVERPAF
jgi:peptidoglycan hydrolase CwlO-like protein